MELEAAVSYRSDETGQGETRCAVLEWALLIRDLFRSDVGLHAKKLVELLHCDSFCIETVRNRLKSVKLCRKLVRKSFSRMLEDQRFTKEVERREEKEHAVDNDM